MYEELKRGRKRTRSFPFVDDEDYLQNILDGGMSKKPPECRVIGCHEDGTDHRKLCSIHYDTYCVTGIRKDCCNCEECLNE